MIDFIVDTTRIMVDSLIDVSEMKNFHEISSRSLRKILLTYQVLSKSDHPSNEIVVLRLLLSQPKRNFNSSNDS